MVDLKQFLVAIDEFENFGIARDVTIAALKDSISSLFVKKNYEDTRVEVEVDVEKGDIKVSLIKQVVDNSKEDELDDNVEITLDEAREFNPDVQVGEDLYIDVNLDNLKKSDVNKIKSAFKQKIKEAEKQAIYQAFADKKGELISGTVEKIEPTYTIVNIGKTSVTLPNNRKIGDETFSIGQTIKVLLAEINSGTGGPQLIISRSDPNFLKRLFEEEVHEIYDGTVVIRDVARYAGERSKISVYSTQENVDPIGACIGPGGSKIQKICAQIGKEKIDVVEYHEYPGLFIAEALKPAKVLGVRLDEEAHSAVAVVENDSLRVAIGKRGINVILAVKLTGWKIDIKEQDTAIGENVVYMTVDQMIRKEDDLRLERIRADLLKVTDLENQNPIVPEEETVGVETPEEKTPETEEKVIVEEEKPVEIPFEEQKVEVNLSQPRVSLADLENQIELDKKKKASAPVQPKKKFVKKEDEANDKPRVEEEKEENKPVVNAMPIYSDEELEAFEDEEEEDNSYDEDIDYSDYDSYYDN